MYNSNTEPIRNMAKYVYAADCRSILVVQNELNDLKLNAVIKPASLQAC